MARVDDVAAYVIQKHGTMTAMKLHKLLYYSHAWHLVWDEKPLFPERIEAWANGPVAPHVYDNHRGQFRINHWRFGNPDCLNVDETETIDIVLEAYADLTAHELSNMTHREAPWRNARYGKRPGEWSKEQITNSAMAEYYDSLYEEIEPDNA